MARDMIAAAIDKELRRWPQAQVKYERRARHRSAVLSFNGASQFITLPISTSDSQRSHKNAVALVRRALEGMGAASVSREPVSKREREDMAEAGAVARLGINKTAIILTIPKASKLFKRFVSKGRPSGYWAYEMRPNADPKGQPHLAVVSRAAPENSKNRKAHAGIMAGTVNKASGNFMLPTQHSTLPKLVKRFGTFSSTPVEIVSETGNEIIFAMPEDRKPLIVQHLPVKEPEPAPLDPEKVEQLTTLEESGLVETPAPIAPEAGMMEMLLARLLQQQPQVVQPQVNLDKPITLLPREPVSMERAVSALNAMKNKYGDDIQFTVGAGGFLVVRSKLGGMPR